MSKKEFPFYILVDREGFKTIPKEDFTEKLRKQYDVSLYNQYDAEVRVPRGDQKWLLRMFVVSAVNDRINEVKGNDGSESDDR